MKRFLAYILIAAFLTACGCPEPAQAATNAQSIQFLLSQVRNSSGALAGGKVYFYAAGTSTPKTVWLNRSKTTVAANPYTLTSNGTAQLFGDGLYRVVIKTAAGVTIPGGDMDNLSFKDITDYTVDVADYASLSAAIAAIGSTSATLQYSADQTLAANLTVPANVELMPVNGAKINQGAYTFTYNGDTSRWPDAQMFTGGGSITIANGVADPEWFGTDAQACNKAIAAVAGSPSGIVTVDGLFTVTSPVTMKSNVTLEINGEIRAVSGFAGGAVIQAVTDISAFDENINISGTGIINANNIAQDGISIKRGRFWTISPRVWGATRYGMRLGHVGAASGSYEIHVTSPQVWRGDYANSAGSVGVYHENCTDSSVSKTVAQGYRRGFQTDSGSVHYYYAHSWGRLVNGPITHSFYINGSNCTLVSCDSDGPHNINPDGAADGSITDVYGFWLGRFDVNMYGCRSIVNSNPDMGILTDGLVTAVHIDQADGLFGGIYGMKADGAADHRHKNMFTGVTNKNLTVLGLSVNPDRVVNPSTIVEQTNQTSAYGFQLNLKTVGVDQPTDVVLDSVNSPRWRIRKSAASEVGSNAGSDLTIDSFDDAGVYKQTPLFISRQFGTVTVGDPTATTTANLRLNGATATTVGGAGGAAALPATPVGYLRININGTERKIPYY